MTTPGQVDDLQAGDTASGPLSGLLVADFSRIVAGPMAAQVLGDLGADIVKVEHPDGDDPRRWGPPWTKDGTSTYFLAVNRNKRSVRLDLKDPSDLALARELAHRADVLIENMKPGGMDGLGLGYDVLASDNPRLVYVSLTGYGPGSPRPGYDFLLQAESGLMSTTGTADGEPLKVGVPAVDIFAAHYAAIGVCSALFERERSGRGQRVELSLMGAAQASLVNQASAWLNGGVTPRPMGNSHPSITPYEPFAAADGTIIIATGSEPQWQALCAAVDRPDLVDDPRFRTNADRVTHRAELLDLLGERIAEHPKGHWLERLARAGVPCGSVNDVPAGLELAAAEGTNPVVELGGYRGIASPLGFSRTPVSYRLPPPGLGDQDDGLRAWLSAPTGPVS